MNKRVVVGMSGGVDSAVAAYLLKNDGYDVIGVTLRTWDSGDSRCCAIDDARDTAAILGIRYHVQNCLSEFREKVEQPFIESYLQGKTPSPCVICNREVKWEQLIYAAELFQAEYVATGHYSYVVRLDNGRYAVRRGADTAKDQSYMLSRLTQEQLARTIMPLGGIKKDKVRSIAEEAGIPSASKPDSQEICFVTEGDYGDYIESHTADSVEQSGDIIDTSGKLLGRHKGLFRYTIGQRRGLGVSGGRPLYVVGKDLKTNSVILGSEKDLYSSELTAADMNWMSIQGLETTIKVRAKIRFSQSFADAEVIPLNDDRVIVRFDEPQRAVTPGQAVVLYDGDMIAGGGIIE